MEGAATSAPTLKEFGWVLLELMGHRQRVGLAREEEIAGSLVLRIDIPTEGDEYVTEYYGGSSIYALRPISEDVAKDHFAARDPRPIKRADYQRRPQVEHYPDDANSFEDEDCDGQEDWPDDEEHEDIEGPSTDEPGRA
ncbi:MAG: hypothetical protein AAFQ51_12215 [Pseudomonadota bacterium]